MRIVIGIDDSPHSEAALKWVAEMPWPKDTKITLVSVPEVTAYVLIDPSGVGLYEQLHQEQLQNCRELVARSTEPLQSSRVAAEGRVEHGDPRDVIVRTAEHEHADLIVVGSHGRTGFPKLLMGSVASYVVAHAPCTVVVVKRPRGSGGKS